jgi:hypothetical protein
MTYTSRFTALFLLSTLAACGGKSFDVAGNEGGSSGAGGTSNVAGRGGSGSNGGGSQAGAGPTAGSGTGGTGQGGEGPDACQAFNDDAGTFIQVVIANETAETIYVGDDTSNSCAVSQELFRVEDASGELLSIDATCRTTCDVARTQGPSGCPSICRGPSVISLQPGEEHRMNFSGLKYVETKLPRECVTSPNGTQQCSQAKLLEPGLFAFSAIAGSGYECALSSTQCGTCQPDGTGGCTINGATRAGTTLNASTKVLLDGSYGIYPKKLPPPGDAAPAEPGGSGAIALPQIRIVFF